MLSPTFLPSAMANNVNVAGTKSDLLHQGRDIVEILISIFLHNC